MWNRKESLFFFEKKKQKTFAILPIHAARAALQQKKSFCFFFFRKSRVFWQSRARSPRLAHIVSRRSDERLVHNIRA